MSTLSVQKIFAALLTATGAFLVWQGMQHSYYGRFGPGSGFFPIWVGVLLLGLSALLVVQSFLARPATDEAPAPFFADRSVLFRPLIVAAACWLVIPALSIFGFRLTMLVFVLAMPFVLGRQRWYVIVPVAVLASFGTAYIFEAILRVRVPHASLPFLQALGL